MFDTKKILIRQLWIYAAVFLLILLEIPKMLNYNIDPGFDHPTRETFPKGTDLRDWEP